MLIKQNDKNRGWICIIKSDKRYIMEMFLKRNNKSKKSWTFYIYNRVFVKEHDIMLKYTIIFLRGVFL